MAQAVSLEVVGLNITTNRVEKHVFSGKNLQNRVDNLNITDPILTNFMNALLPTKVILNAFEQGKCAMVDAQEVNSVAD